MKTLLVVAITFLLVSCSTLQDKKERQVYSELVSSLYDSTLAPFYHGVASGDPLQDRVIIWTRVTPQERAPSIEVSWEVADDNNFANIITKGQVKTDTSRDYTVKVDVTGLSPAKRYYYRFKAFEKLSPIGKTKTLPDASVDSLKLAVVSCSNWEFGYFNPYDRIAEKDIDAMVHLGDYIYEYGQGTYADKTVNRKHLPAHEIVTLLDYRTRYSQYHLDQGLRNVRAAHPLIAIWDDHEVANDVYTQGAQNHQPDKEGEFARRKAAAKKAYYEWLPVREGVELYRSFTFGNLADLIMLDERLAGRTKPAESIDDPSLQSSERSMLGQEQLEWFQKNLKASKAKWKIIGNQVIFSDLDYSTISSTRPKNLDSWDGYPGEKKKIKTFIKDNSIRNVVFLAGDSHASWAFETKLDASRQSDNAVAIEFGTTSVSSGNWNEITPDDTVMMRENQLLKANPHLKFVNERDHGYLLLTLYHNQAKAEWYYVQTLKQIDPSERLAKTFTVSEGSNKLTMAD
jgi:alkaline phosphatase D